MPLNKNSFQPKDARAVSIYHQDDMDDEMDDLLSHNSEKVTSSGNKKIMTGTQALVEFLKTTSPEEFQRSTVQTERSSNIFSRIGRKQKRSTQPPAPIPSPSLSSRSVPSSTASLPVTLTSTSSTVPTSYHGSELLNNNTIHRKNYIEIVPQQSQTTKMISRSAGNSRSPSFETTTSIQSFVLRNNNNNNNTNNKGAAERERGEPILPNKKRESSLYSGSLRHSVSIKSQLSTTHNNRISAGRPSLIKIDLKNASTADEYLTTKSDSMDTIESALLQRLERLKLMNHDIPSDQIATGLATEHIRALGITHTLDNITNYQQHDDKRKIRHMQVQTEQVVLNTSDMNVQVENDTTQDTTTTTTSTEEENDDYERRARRAEAALENALDHFEVISGLAYKKLREIWEEKMRWENACMELRDRLVLLEQKKYPFQQQAQQHQHQHQQQQQNNGGGFHAINNNHDYFLEENEEEDELGLSEFPCSE
jgi:hypothetical protein